MIYILSLLLSKLRTNLYLNIIDITNRQLDISFQFLVCKTELFGGGVAICGRPVSRHLDDGLTLEINRLCTDGTKNACSILYGACARIAKNMGYKRVITYILKSENGASLKASNFICEGEAGGEMWTGKRSGRDNGVPKEKKTRWAKYF